MSAEHACPECDSEMLVTDPVTLGGTVGVQGGRIPESGRDVFAECRSCGRRWRRPADFPNEPWRPL